MRRQDNRATHGRESRASGDLYHVGGRSGLHKAFCGLRTRFPVSTRIRKGLDAPALGLAASYGTIAIASGSDGLFEVPVLDAYSGSVSEPQPTVEMPCEDCNWAFQSIFASSSIGAGFQVEYSRYRDGRYERPERFFEDVGDERYDRPRRFLEGVRPATGIFGHERSAWGVQDKICLAYNGSIEVVRYRPWLRDRGTNEGLQATNRVRTLWVISTFDTDGEVRNTHNSRAACACILGSSVGEPP
jgi:hypothetical protein